jgi:hypothetical protein
MLSAGATQVVRHQADHGLAQSRPATRDGGGAVAERSRR